MAKLGLEQVDCYKLARAVFREAYGVAGNLPIEERYNPANQMRGATTSVCLNIAEGYGRYHYLDKIRFYYISRGSLMELKASLQARFDGSYIDETDLQSKRNANNRSLKALNGLIRYTHRSRQGSAEFGTRSVLDVYLDCDHESENHHMLVVPGDDRDAINYTDSESRIPDSELHF